MVKKKSQILNFVLQNIFTEQEKGLNGKEKITNPWFFSLFLQQNLIMQGLSSLFGWMIMVAVWKQVL